MLRQFEVYKSVYSYRSNNQKAVYTKTPQRTIKIVRLIRNSLMKHQIISEVLCSGAAAFSLRFSPINFNYSEY